MDFNILQSLVIMVLGKNDFTVLLLLFFIWKSFVFVLFHFYSVFILSN